MPVTLIGGGANLVGGIIKGIVGAGQKKQGKKILNGLQYPTESIPGEIVQNKNLAEQQAAAGLPSEQYNNAMRDIQRQQLMAIRSAHDRRGGLAAVSGIQQGTNDATNNLNSIDAQQKIRNQNQLMNANNTLAGWKDKIWQNNVMGKYNQQYNYGMGLLGMGNQNFVGGIDQGLAGVGKAASGYLTGTGGLKNGGINNLTVDNTDQSPYGNNYNTYG